MTVFPPKKQDTRQGKTIVPVDYGATSIDEALH